MEININKRIRELKSLIKQEKARANVCACSKQDMLYLQSLEEELDSLLERKEI